jgi:N-terminal domain of galactosyltransferase
MFFLSSFFAVVLPHQNDAHTNTHTSSQYPNNFWGWGGEDDEMQRRLERLSMTFDAPTSGSMRDLEAMNINEKMEFLRNHKEWKCMVKWELQSEHETTWKTNGLADLKYEIIAQEKLNSSATKITVHLKLNGTHWTNEKAGVSYMP